MTAPGAEVVEERVRLPGRETRITIGPGVARGVGAAVREAFPRARRVGVVLDAGLAAAGAPEVHVPGADLVRLEAPGGEPAKTREVLARLQDGLLDLRRDEPVVVLGGGAVLDVGGFAAATVRRGLPWVAVPSTVVAMADASVGGKVAINHPRGKNLLGTFHPPVRVLADPRLLATVAPRDVRSGLAEIYKMGRIGDPDLLGRLAAGPPGDAAAWTPLLARAVAGKARLVEQDERDHGPRRLLNLGHTVGHALERLLPEGRLRHGEGVAIGMVAAAAVARARGLLDAAAEAALVADLDRLGLPTTLPDGALASDVLSRIALDKKRREGDAHVFVLPAGPARCVVVEDVAEAEVEAALVALR